jgi:hypothetical protein
MQLRHSARPLSNRHSTGSVFRLLPIQLSGPEVLLRAARPEWPYPAATLRVRVRPELYEAAEIPNRGKITGGKGLLI